MSQEHVPVYWSTAVQVRRLSVEDSRFSGVSSYSLSRNLLREFVEWELVYLYEQSCQREARCVSERKPGKGRCLLVLVDKNLPGTPEPATVTVVLNSVP